MSTASRTTIPAGLSAEQEELFRRLLEKQGLSDSAAAIPRRDRSCPPPLSFAQQRLWFLDRLEPGGAAYNMPFALSLEGRLDAPALRRAVAGIVARHESLRTRFATAGDRAVQEIDDRAPVRLPVVDLTGLGDRAREGQTLALLVAEAHRPFDLARRPLLRQCLLRRGGEDHVLLANMHHIVSDGWSVGVFVRELGAHYAAYLEDREPELPELPIQYGDFAAWQREHLSGERLREQLDYWSGRLEGAATSIRLPADRARPVWMSSRGDKLHVRFPVASVAGVEEVGRRHDCTPFMALLAVFMIWLHRVSGQDDLTVGSPVANRTREELEGLIGFFVNSLVLRGDLSGDPGFGSLLGRVRETTLGAFEHQDLPFERLVQEVAQDRETDRHPLFHVRFAVQNAPLPKLALPGLSAELLDMHPRTSKFDLMVELWEEPKGFAKIEYNTDLFDRATVERLGRQLEALFRGVAETPGLPVSALPLLSPAERHQAVVEWNDPLPAPELGAAEGACLHERILAWAGRTPDAVALVFEGEELDYRGLAERVHRLAHHLIALGVGPETPVPLLLPRSLDQMVAVLGVLAAGGAYAPLDPEVPAARLGRQIAELLRWGAPVALTSDALAPAIEDAGLAAVRIDGDAGAIAARFAGPPPPAAGPGNAAYVLYTSGSTGIPKGVVVEHRQIVSYATALAARHGIGPDASFAVVQPLVFDSAKTAIYPVLVAGGTVHVLPKERALDAVSVGETFRRHRIDGLKITPSHLEALQRDGDPADVLPRRWLFLGGEASRHARLLEMAALDAGRAIVNHYGPTETTVGVATCRAEPEVPRGPSLTLPVGRPLAGMRLYAVDRNLRPVPTGAAGELLVGGPQVSRGYLGRPAATAERYVPDPFAGGGGRLYRTGDLVRHQAGGRIEFLGRIDHQVKVRGFRVETAEIEAALLEGPEVRDAVVVPARAPGDDESWNDRLIAYVVPGELAEEPDAGSAREQVKDWRAVFDDVFAGLGDGEDGGDGFDVTGWVSSYTGELIPPEEMEEWVESAAGWILRDAPRRILEIGFGTGLMLKRLAPEAERYLATDFSRSAVTALREVVAGDDVLRPRVELLHREAADFGGIEPGSFDAVVINSVVQYFPTCEHLVEVLRGAVAALAPGGTVFVGDVRSLPLLEALHTDLELAGAEDELAADNLRQRIALHGMQEEELVLDPEVFVALADALDGVARVELQLKRGARHNELTRFRYDAILHKRRDGANALAGPPQEPALRLDWRADPLDPERLARRLRENREAGGGPVLLGGVPNRRVARASRAIELLSGAEAGTRVGNLRAVLDAEEAPGLDPEELRGAASAAGFDAETLPGRTGAADVFAVLFRPRGETPAPVEVYPGASGGREWRSYATDPLRGRTVRRLVPKLKARLEATLPPYMLPAAYVVLDELPRTVNGKLDRRALPDPQWSRVGEYVAPRNAAEERMAAIWRELLQIDRVGVNDNFFSVGGHSLLATRLVAEVRDSFHVDLPLRAAFEAPTIAELTERIETERSSGDGELGAIAAALAEVQGMTDEEALRLLQEAD